MMRYLFAILCLCFLNFTLHEFHVSKCLLNYSEKDQALQISIHVFIDDLENDLKKYDSEKLYLGTPDEIAIGDSLVEAYIKDYLKIQIDGSQKSFNYIGKEVSEDLIALWCYFEIENVHPSKSIEVYNNILMEQFDDQKNIINIKGPDNTKAYFLFREDYINDKLEIE
ncbi:MAG: DUF6702 family protein [Bacteroidota bacterium]